ncbi:phosphatase PAP2 family protein [Halomonas sp. MCCC 1A17488]|uniref:phosphatase PAP2 family protein n=1 Tax=unclassified Halomonas TaxID=2609666 RepID=UPI0018D22D9B|nr:MULTISPECIES: phosphatase PAP2 family protein [unclassified Halomonas]MCE8017704.1 phosphatase PAP2 family protein [Halomonas sp. MCCC 1A17488]MCG3241037.1 phosphatase PAP2 family protein [Halomonas sp. MCCC 1A17488]QPP48899.1 phosphatase PAP2 family protein [Halomonas sp. SS10-MC5]
MKHYRKIEHVRRHGLSLLARLGRYELAVLLCVSVLSGGVWGFIELADAVIEGETQSIDETLLLSMRNPADHTDPLGPGWVEEMGRDFTALGGVGVLVVITLGALGYLLLARHYRAALFASIVVPGGMLLSTLMKMGFDRPRPDLVPHEAMVYTASFPSGHSMMSAVTYLTLAALLIRVQPALRLKAYLLILAILLTLLVGMSRVYLGVHWPTDVLAGWTAGAAWAALCWLVMRWLQRRGQVETEESSSGTE